MYDKSEVKFEHPAKGPHHCSECVHFIQLIRRCKIVRGEIDPKDWCSQFKPKEGKK